MGLLEPHGRGSRPRREARLSGRRIIVHSLDHARTALAAAAGLGVAVTLASAEGAGGYAGPLWWMALIEAASHDFPDVPLTAVLDCADEPGAVLGALRAGIKRVRFTGADPVRQRLAAIAHNLGAEIENEGLAEGLDLSSAPHPATACHAFLAGNETPN